MNSSQETGLPYAAKVGDMELFDFFLDKIKYEPEKIDIYNHALFGAVDNENEKIIDKLLQLGADDFTKAMSSAAFVGNEKLFDLFLSLGGDPIDHKTIYSAAAGGNEKILKKLITLGNDNYESALQGAIETDNVEIVQYILSFAIPLGFDDFNSGLQMAAMNGSQEIVNIFLELGADNYKRAAMEASLSGHGRLALKIRNYGNSRR